jgi:tetratricopeptide (TPR) repeat protein
LGLERQVLRHQALTLDPAYAASHSYLAYWHIFRVGEGFTTDPEADVEAARVARAAIERDEQDGLARAIFGHVQSFLFRDYDAALAHFEGAVEVSPNCAEAWSMSSITLGYLGDSQAAVERAAHGLRLRAHLLQGIHPGPGDCSGSRRNRWTGRLAFSRAY